MCRCNEVSFTFIRLNRKNRLLYERKRKGWSRSSYAMLYQFSTVLPECYRQSLRIFWSVGHWNNIAWWDSTRDHTFMCFFTQCTTVLYKQFRRGLQLTQKYRHNSISHTESKCCIIFKKRIFRIHLNQWNIKGFLKKQNQTCPGPNFQ